MGPLNWNTIGSIIGVPVGLLCFLYVMFGLKKKKDLKGKVVLITGANSGLGEACAKVFFEAGCRIVLAGRNLQELQRVKTKLKGDDQVGIVIMDLSDVKSLAGKADEAVKIFGRVDILVNNAGISYQGQVEDTSIDVFVRLMTVNFFGQVALTKGILAHMLDHGEGCIVGISSVQGKIAIPYRSAYTASKHALQAFHDSLRAEVVDKNIDVILISPSYIRTNLSKNAVCADGSKHGTMTKEIATGMSPDYCANCVLSAVRWRQKDITPAPIHHKMAIFIRNLCPWVFFEIMAVRARQGKHEYVKNK